MKHTTRLTAILLATLLLAATPCSIWAQTPDTDTIEPAQEELSTWEEEEPELVQADAALYNDEGISLDGDTNLSDEYYLYLEDYKTPAVNLQLMATFGSGSAPRAFSVHDFGGSLYPNPEDLLVGTNPYDSSTVYEVEWKSSDTSVAGFGGSEFSYDTNDVTLDLYGVGETTVTVNATIYTGGSGSTLETEEINAKIIIHVEQSRNPDRQPFGKNLWWWYDGYGALHIGPNDADSSSNWMPGYTAGTSKKAPWLTDPWLLDGEEQEILDKEDIKEVRLYDGIRSVGEYVFADYPNLHTVYAEQLSTGTQQLEFIESHAFYQSSLADFHFIEMLPGAEEAPSGNLFTVGNVVEVGENAFAGTNLGWFATAGLDTIGDEAFADTLSLAGVAPYLPDDGDEGFVITEDLVFFGEAAFSGSAIFAVLLDGEDFSLKEIPASAFSGGALQQAELPSSLRKIGDYAFQKTKLQRIVLPASVNEIGEAALASASLDTVVVLNTAAPTSSISLFANNAFYDSASSTRVSPRFVLVGQAGSLAIKQAQALGLAYYAVDEIDESKDYGWVPANDTGSQIQFYGENGVVKGQLSLPVGDPQDNLPDNVFYTDESTGYLRMDAVVGVSDAYTNWFSYVDKNGLMLRNTIVKGYYYDPDGRYYFIAYPERMVTLEDGLTYLLGTYGAVQKDRLYTDADGNTYYFTAGTGAMLTNGEHGQSYFGPDGKMVKNTEIAFTIASNDTVYRYYDENGLYVTDQEIPFPIEGTQKINYSYYDENGFKVMGQEVTFIDAYGDPYYKYYDENGNRAYGMIDDKYYDEASGGRRGTGWHKIDGIWKYFDPETGISTVGWIRDIPGWTNDWFYFDRSGKMLTNWQNNIPGWEGDTFHFGTNGVMTTGWLPVQTSPDTAWFYFDTNTGIMVINKWVTYNGNQYYLGDNGIMLINTWTPDGYWVDDSGKWIA